MEVKKAQKRIVALVIAIGLILSFIVGGIFNLRNQNNKIKTLDPELLRTLTYGEFEEGSDKIDGTDNVKFSAFFLRDLDGDGYAESVKGTCKEIGKQDTLYMEVNILSEGYLKNGKIEINGQNFYLQTALPKDDQLKENYIGNNTKTIELNDLINGTQKMITGFVRSGNYSNINGIANAIGNNTDNYSRNDNKIVFTGTYVTENGTETSIRKEIPLIVDWYGTTKAQINPKNEHKKQTYTNLAERIDEENEKINLEFSIYTGETNKALLLSKNHVEGTIQELNGYSPISVTCNNSNVEFNYDEQTKKFTIDRVSSIREDETVQNSMTRENNYTINVTYPLEAYTSIGTETFILRIPVETYYEGYNNENEEFRNPFRSNVATSLITTVFNNGESDFATNIYVGKYTKYPDRNAYRYVVSKEKPLKIYNEISSEEKDDIYTVRWGVQTGNDREYDKIELKEDISGNIQNGDNFVKTNASTESMENITTNIGIGFSKSQNFLKDGGEIKIYDDVTGDLIVTFNKDDINKYSESSPYKYTTPIKHIRIEATSVNKDEKIEIYNIKELDDEYITENYTLEEFNEISEIESHVKSFVNNEYAQTRSNIGYYEANFAYATIGISKNAISTQGTEEHDIIKIKTHEDNSLNLTGWINGSFLVKLPQEVLDLEINNVEIDSYAVDIVSYEVLEKDGNLFIKINTSNKNPITQSYEISIDCNISADPRIATSTKQIELYATNENENNYYKSGKDIYDLNENLNTEELVNKTLTNITFVSPSSLITAEIATNYDQEGNVTISPQIADIKPTYNVVDSENLTSDVSVYLKNNYSSTISDITILGNIPFEGNKYIISKQDLGSTFTTKILNTGISIPEEVREYAVVYYSDVQEPTNDLTDESNNWKTQNQITNWENIKTYLITLNDYQMPVGKELNFVYKIQVPSGLDFNKVAYCDHGVYFSLLTEEGKYRTKTEPNKIGFRIAEKYDIELTKYQLSKDKTVKGATYKITEEGTSNVKTATTNDEGKLLFKNIYAEKTYIIEEIKVPTEYELNIDKVKIIGHVNRETGRLTIEKLDGTTKNDIEIEKEEGKDYIAKIEVEDEVKANLKIKKIDQGTGAPISKVKFKILENGLAENGKVISTNANGDAVLKGLKIGEIYCIEETKADGYYLGEKIYLKVLNTNGVFEVKIVDQEGNELENQGNQDVRIEINEDIPTVELKIKDEKIPTYDLEITKIKNTTKVESSQEEGTEGNENTEELTYLQGAKFRLYKDGKDLGEYITDENGKLTINNLYAFEENKNVDQTYILKEILAPEGYTKVKDITFKVAKNSDETYSFEETLLDGQTAKEWTLDGNTVKLTVKDNPSFKLIKKDGETLTLLPNVKFAIYNVDDGERPATNSKGEIIGTKEIINGKEYYVVITDENGEISVDLPEGYYKAQEVYASSQYDIKSNIYYFGIGGNRAPAKSLSSDWGKIIGGSSSDNIVTFLQTSDGGYILAGYTNGNVTLENGEILRNKGGSFDSFIIKYDSERIFEWANQIGSNKSEYINSIIETNDGGYIVGGYFDSANITLNNGETIQNHGTNTNDAFLIKYNSEGIAQWGKTIGGTGSDSIRKIVKTTDGGYFAIGHFTSETITLEDGTVLTNQSNNNTDVMLLKYNENDQIQWAKTIGGANSENINSMDQTNDGGYFVAGSFTSETLTLENGEVLTNHNYPSEDIMIIKYNSNGEIEWGKSLGTGHLNSSFGATQINDGGFVLGFEYYNKKFTFDNGTELENPGTYSWYVALVKFNTNGEIEWAKNLVKEGNTYFAHINKTKDGGFYIRGPINGTGILEDGDTFSRNDIIKFNSSGEKESIIKTDVYASIIYENDDGSIIIAGTGSGTANQTIEFDSGETANWKGGNDIVFISYHFKDVPSVDLKKGKIIGGTKQEQIHSIAKTLDGGAVAVGTFQSETITLENGDILTNNGNTSYTDGMIVKYDSKGQVEWGKVIGGNGNDDIDTVFATSDGGFIIGGEFQSETITLENGDILRNSHYSNYKNGMIIKYDKDGNIEWTKTIDGIGNDYISSIVETNDGNYAVGGFFDGSISLDNGDTLVSKGSMDGMILKLSSRGDTIWGKSFGGSGNDYIRTVTEKNDGKIIAGGDSLSAIISLDNGDIISTKGSYDGIITQYNSNGDMEYFKTIGGSGAENIYSVTKTSDGGFIIGGSFSSSSISLESGEIITSRSGSDGLIIKYNSEGNIEWTKTVKGTGNNNIRSIIETSDGGYAVGGYFGNTIELDNKEILVSSNYNFDGFIIKYLNNGETEWGKGIGYLGNDYVYSMIEDTANSYIIGGYSNSSSLILNREIELISNGDYDGLLVKVTPVNLASEMQELTVENERFKYKITTDVNEIDGIKGGSISGEDQQPYEIVKHGDDSLNEIKMIPDENYEIINITVNGQEYPFEVDEFGNYTMPKFENVTENKHIVVTYSLRDNKITINKIDSVTGEKLTGAKFKLDQLDEREEPNNNEIIGNLTENGGPNYVLNTENNITSSVLGELTNNGTYYFVQNEDGTITPTNSKTYQIANGGTEGKKDTTANSYMKVDLRGLTGKYRVVINARMSAYSNNYGYANITKNTSAPAYSSSTGRVFRISGDNNSNDYMSDTLDGGSLYYLHFGYRKYIIDSEPGEDQLVINSVNVYGTNQEIFNFEEINGKYESTNQGKASTTCNSYIPIDLTGYEGKYDLVVNANVSSESYSDYGYATVTTNTTAPVYNTSTGRFIYISGTSETYTTPKDYKTVLQGGQLYYLHLGYYKNSSINDGEDKFTVNSIRIELNGDHLYHTEAETNSEGKAFTQIPFGKYAITEIVTPDGYQLNEEPKVVEFRGTPNAVHEFTIENKKIGEVIVHHYIKGTQTKVAEDENSRGNQGDRYTTSPKLDLEKYELELDTNGEFVLPENAAGEYRYETQEITYYYVPKTIPLIVHHYIEGTTNKVPLANGNIAEDIETRGEEHQEYTTNSLNNSELAENYELVEEPNNKEGTYEYPEVEVTYYYKKIERNIVINKLDEDGVTSIPNVTFVLLDNDENEINTYTTNEDGKIYLNLAVGIYKLREISPADGYKRLEEDKEIIISRDTENNLVINITNEKKSGKVIVYHYLEGTTTPIELESGEDPTQTKQDKVGKIYATSPRKDTAIPYEIVSEEVENGSGEFIDGTIEVTYYYRTIPTSVLVHHYIQGTTTKLSDDETINGYVGKNYETNPADVGILYKLATEPDNKSGKMAKGQIVVTYYYRLKQAEYTTNITKTATERITKENQEITYNIEYTASIDKYVGDAVVTIKDDLPYIIDETNSELNGGLYNSENKTITWTENVENIDTYSTGEVKQINLNKQIKVVYKNQDVTKDIENKVTGKLELLDTDEEETKETTAKTQQEYKINIKAVKIWDDNSNSALKRPGKVIIQVLKGTEVVKEKELTNTYAKDFNTWEYMFENLPKYDEHGKQIEYSVNEKEIESIYYSKTEVKPLTEIDNQDKNITNKYETEITNKFEVPVETVEITVNKEWKDNSNASKKRPTSITFEVKGNGKIYQEVISGNEKTNEGWTCTFTVPKYDKNGDEIRYTIDELETNSYYEKTEVGILEKVVKEKDLNQDIEENHSNENTEQNTTTNNTSELIGNTPSNSNTTENTTQSDNIEQSIVEYEENKYVGKIVNTFIVPEDKIEIEVTKIWSDNENVYGVRPNSIKVELTGKGTKADGTKGIIITKSQILTTENVSDNTNTWKYTFENLKKYDSYGDEIEYTIDEKVVEDNQYYYEKTVGGTTITNTFNEPKEGTAVITKIDMENSEKLKGAKFNLTDKDGNILKVIKVEGKYELSNTSIENRLETDGQGKIVINKLPFGKYRLIEVEAPEGYVKSEEIKEFEIDINSYKVESNHVKNIAKEIIVENARIIAKILKVDDDGNPLPGAKLQLIDEEGNIVDEWITTNEPHPITSIVKGSYIIREVEAPEGYEKSPDQEITIEEKAEEQEYISKDEKVNVTLEITKVDSENHLILLPGARYKLEKIIKNEERIDNTFETQYDVTNLFGKLSFNDLPYGTYRLTEEKAPIGYKLTEEPIEIVINEETAPNNKMLLTLQNTRKIALPATGGQGLINVTIIIGLMIMGAGIYLRKKH